MDLENPSPSLTAAIRYLRAEGKTDKLPPRVWKLLESTNPASPEYDEQYSRALRSHMDSLLSSYYSRRSPQLEVDTAMEPEVLNDLYKDFFKGMLYAADHFDRKGEESEIKQVRVIGMRPESAKLPHAWGYVSRRDPTEVGVLPRLVAIYLDEAQLRQKNKLRGNGRIHQDDKMPGKYFNAKEVMILTGIEEAVHMQQIIKGRFTDAYDSENLDYDEYDASTDEIEAAQVEQQAVNDLHLGSSVKDPGQSFASTLLPPSIANNTPKARADLRRQQRKKGKPKR